MRYAYRLSLLYILVAALATTSVSGFQQTKPNINIGRFARGISAAPSKSTSANVTETEAHAKWLMSRKPTRRSTALRRQASDTPLQQLGLFSALDTGSGTSFGSLVYGPSGWTISSGGSPSSLVYSGSSSLVGRDAREAQRLTYSPQDASDPYIYFGVGQCFAGSPTTIGAGSSNVLCLVNSATATRAGALPAKVSNNLDHSGSSYAETDIWTLDYSVKTAAPTWINADGSATRAYIVVAVNNLDIVFVTGDVAATSAHYGLEFRPVTLTYTNLPVN